MSRWLNSRRAKRPGIIDPQKRVTGVILTQILSFADDRVVRLYGQFERSVYNALQN
jgi:hypothetical protein